MRLQTFAARAALAALVVALLLAAAAVISVRLNLLPFGTGLELMLPATLLGLLALAAALAWLWQAARRNAGR